jgi:hypothetical protein
VERLVNHKEFKRLDDNVADECIGEIMNGKRNVKQDSKNRGRGGFRVTCDEVAND